MRLLRLSLLGIGLVLAVAAYGLLRDDLHQTVLRSLPAPAVGLSGIVAGLVAWSRRPGNRLGPLMVAFGFAWLIRPWQYSDNGVAFTVSFALGWLGAALFAHIALAYPTGRVTDRLERLLVRAGYVVALAFPIATLLFYDGSADVKYVRPGVPSEILVTASDTAVEVLDKGFVLVMWGVLAPCFVALVIRKFVRATPRARRVLLPVLLAALIAALQGVLRVPAHVRDTAGKPARSTARARGQPLLVAGDRPDRAARRAPRRAALLEARRGARRRPDADAGSRPPARAQDGTRAGGGRPLARDRVLAAGAPRLCRCGRPSGHAADRPLRAGRSRSSPTMAPPSPRSSTIRACATSPS